jgi:hypothetical protein
VQTLAFPIRLQENGLLRRQDEMASILGLLQVMARTPAVTWAGAPRFGLRDLFEVQRNRADIARIAMQRVNEGFADLGITNYLVTEVVRELSSQREVDTYSITISKANSEERFTTTVTPSL